MPTLELTESEQDMVVEGLGLLCEKYQAGYAAALAEGTGALPQSVLAQRVNECSELRGRINLGGAQFGS